MASYVRQLEKSLPSKFRSKAAASGYRTIWSGARPFPPLLMTEAQSPEVGWWVGIILRTSYALPMELLLFPVPTQYIQLFPSPSIAKGSLLEPIIPVSASGVSCVLQMEHSII